MFEARIITDRGSLYYASEATRYDLQTLQWHLRDCRAQSVGSVTLELTVHDGPHQSRVIGWLQSIAEAGYHVRLLHKSREIAA